MNKKKLVVVCIIAVGYIFILLSRLWSIECEEGYIFSEKDCECVLDSFGCAGLDKEACEKNPNCYSFSRDGSCSCPSCAIYLEHQCLPIKR